jgi:hypothetical protein
MMSLTYMIICVLCMLMAVLLINTGSLLHRKQQMQNAADAAAISASTWLTRGMNALTATNHLIGEMTSFVIVHDAIGGKKLDEGKVGNTQVEDSLLTGAWLAAKGMGAKTPAYDTVREMRKVKAGKTILGAKKNLKMLLTKCYATKAFARFLQSIGLVKVGRPLELAMDALEMKIYQEYIFLNALQKAARALTPVKFFVRDSILPLLKAHTEHIVRRFPQLAENAAREVGKAQNVTIALYPQRLELPVQLDPHRYARGPLNLPKLPARRKPPADPSDVPVTSMREQVVKTSQLARATFPWVTYHRLPIINLLAAAAPLSEAAELYKDWTDGTSKELLDEFQKAGGLDLGLYVLKGSTAPDKGYELWTEDRNLADQLFAVQAFAWRKAPAVVGEGAFFLQMYPAGGFASSQALIYNGNPQQPHPFHIPLHYKRILDERQADVGWDTLNWQPGSRPYELVAKTRSGPVRSIYPEIKLNWQTKLVPVNPAHLNLAFKHLPGEFAPITKRVNAKAASLQTH